MILGDALGEVRDRDLVAFFLDHDQMACFTVYDAFKTQRQGLCEKYST